MMTLIAATKNKGKVAEICAILKDLGMDVISQDRAGIDIDVEETGLTFEENALLKACAVCEASGLPAIADDSGLCVDALDGAPGVFSARYAGSDATDGMRIQKLLSELADVPDAQRTARFVSVVALVLPDGRKFTARGEVEGSIYRQPDGEGGFGYDPVFLVSEVGQTFARMSGELKNTVSHRYRALLEMARLLKEKEIDFSSR